jgi:DNA repair exonuclease SbcCD ATPase subunit
MSASNPSEKSLNHRDRPRLFRRLLDLLQRNNQHNTPLENTNALDVQGNGQPGQPIHNTSDESDAEAGQAVETVRIQPQIELETFDSDEDVELAKPESTHLQLAEMEARLRERTEQVETLTGELERVHGLLAEREALLQIQLNEESTQKAAIESLQVANETLETELYTTQSKLEQLEAGQHNLEAALAASIQHTAEQQDALLRWQELAESADECVTGLEKQVAFLQQALHDCNDQREHLHQELDQTSQGLAQAQAQLEVLNHHQETVNQLAEAREQITRLEERVGEDAEALARYKTSLANSQTALLRLERKLGEHAAALETTQSSLASKELTIARSQAVFERLAATLRLKDQSKKRLQVQLNQLAGQAREERALWYKTLKRNEQQLAVTEAELDRFWQGYRAQSQRMAEVQKALLAREQELATATSRMKQQAQLIHQMRLVASGRIKELETARNQVEQQIRDLQLVVERQAKRESVSSDQ